jgi:hypothetical protein
MSAFACLTLMRLPYGKAGVQVDAFNYEEV